MQKNRIVVLGFLHTGSSAFYDAFEDMSSFSFIPFRGEYNHYREVNGLYDQACGLDNALRKRVRLKLLKTVVKFFLRTIYYLISLKYKEHKELTFIQLLKIIRFYFIKAKQERKIKGAKNLEERINYINQLIDLEHGLFSKKGKTSIYAQPYLLEMDHDILLKTFGDKYFHLFVTRDAFEQFYDIEQQDYFFGPYEFREEYMFGRDVDGLLRRKYFCKTLLKRQNDLYKLFSLMPDRCLVYSYNSLIKDPDRFRINISSNFNCKISEHVVWTKLQPTKIRNNLGNSEFFKEKLFMKGYDEELIELVSEIDKNYKVLENLNTQN